MFTLGVNKLGVLRQQGIPEPETLLFAAGEEGVFLDFSTSAFSDITGTTEAIIDSTIAFVEDKSPNGRDATQALEVARPVLRGNPQGRPFSEFDGVTDIIPVTMPTITGGTIAVISLEGVYIESDWSISAGTMNIGPTSIPGLPATIINLSGIVVNVIEDVLAVIINDRAWTGAERAAVASWGVGRGARGNIKV